MNISYKDYDFSYPERVITKEPFYLQNPGFVKCYIPVVMPFIPEGPPMDMEIRVSKHHLVNKELDEDDEGFYEIIPNDSIISSNYVTEYIPPHITSPLRDFTLYYGGGGLLTPTIPLIYRNYFYNDAFFNGIVPPNKEFIISFIGGDVNNRRIVGRYT